MKKRFFPVLTLLTMSAMLLPAMTAVSADTVAPDMTELFEGKQFTAENGYVLNYSIYVPADYDAAKKYPVVLFMHGAGERGNDLKTHLTQGIIEPFKNTESPIYGCIVVAPQCPADKKWVNVAKWTDCIYSTDAIAETEEIKAVLELVGSLKDTYSTDTNRYYCTGLSMGGYATWDMNVRHPEIFAAAMPLCGGADMSKAAAVKEIPIWTFHGLQDTTVPPTGTKTMVNRIQAAGGTKITYTTFENAAHDIWATVYGREDVWEWLLSQDLSHRFPELKQTEPVTEAPTEEPAPAVTDPASTSSATEADHSGTASTGCGASLPRWLPVVLMVLISLLASDPKRRR